MSDNLFSDRFNTHFNDTSITDSYTISAPSQTISPNWKATRGSNELAKQADNKLTHEHYRALLTQTAMTNTTALSTLEVKLSAAVPYAQERLRVIVDAYVMSTVQKIARW